jgi:hypothetical protein
MYESRGTCQPPVSASSWTGDEANLRFNRSGVLSQMSGSLIPMPTSLRPQPVIRNRWLRRTFYLWLILSLLGGFAAADIGFALQHPWFSQQLLYRCQWSLRDQGMVLALELQQAPSVSWDRHIWLGNEWSANQNCRASDVSVVPIGIYLATANPRSGLTLPFESVIWRNTSFEALGDWPSSHGPAVMITFQLNGFAVLLSFILIAAPGINNRLDLWHAARRSAMVDQPQLPVCKSCGYDLRASPDRCPECGSETTGWRPR